MYILKCNPFQQGGIRKCIWGRMFSGARDWTSYFCKSCIPDGASFFAKRASSGNFPRRNTLMVSNREGALDSKVCLFRYRKRTFWLGSDVCDHSETTFSHRQSHGSLAGKRRMRSQAVPISVYVSMWYACPCGLCIHVINMRPQAASIYLSLIHI